MLSSVLNSERAIEANIAIVRAFVRLRAMLATHADLARRLNELEQKYDEQFRVVFEAIRELMTPEPVPPSRRIGFAGKHTKTQEGDHRPNGLADCLLIKRKRTSRASKDNSGVHARPTSSTPSLYRTAIGTYSRRAPVSFLNLRILFIWNMNAADLLPLRSSLNREIRRGFMDFGPPIRLNRMRRHHDSLKEFLIYLE